MMNANQTALLELLKATLFHAHAQFPADTNWDEVLLEAKHQTVLALAAPSVPKEEAHKWREYTDQNTAHYIRVLHAQKELIRLLQSAGIPLVILKGTAAAIYYPNPILRTMGDIDFLAPLAQFESARELMEKSGYVVQYGDTEDGRHIGFVKHGVLFEMHRYFSSFGLNIEPAIMDGFNRRQNVELLGYEFPMLPTLENGLVLLAHIRQHLLEEQYSLGLRQVIDWMMYVRANVNVAGWKDDFRNLTQRYDLDKLAATMTFACNKWFGMPCEVNDMDEAAVDELFDRIMASGNFSTKRDRAELQDKPVQAALQNLRQEGLFRYLQKAGEANWIASQRYRTLRPLAWIYQMGRFAKKGLQRVAQGKPLVRELSEGKQNNVFLKRLGI